MPFKKQLAVMRLILGGSSQAHKEHETSFGGEVVKHKEQRKMRFFNSRGEHCPLTVVAVEKSRNGFFSECPGQIFQIEKLGLNPCKIFRKFATWRKKVCFK